MRLMLYQSNIKVDMIPIKELHGVSKILLNHFFRSSHHVSDIAKMNGNPVLHVNADHPEVNASYAI